MAPALVAALVVGAIAVSALGALIVRHQPRNTIGWSFLVAGGGMGVANLLDQYVFLAFASGVGGLPAATAAVWVITWLPILVVWIPVFAVLFLFPHGRALSRFWAIVWWVAVGAVSGQAVLAMVAPGPMMIDALPNAPGNPLAVDALAPAASLLGSVFWAATSVCVGLAALSMVLRFSRARDAERQQVKWLAFSASFVVVGVAVQAVNIAVGDPAPLVGFAIAGLIVLGLASLPVSATIAILRYRLWEIDRLVSRTLAYAVVVAILAVMYGGSVLGLQALLPTGGSDLAVAASTLAVAAAFRPVRRRVQGTIDRRFNRARYDAQRTMESFAQRLRDEVDLEALSDELRSTVVEAMAPTSTVLWLPSTEARR
jgi:hypothetical protein